MEIDIRGCAPTVVNKICIRDENGDDYCVDIFYKEDLGAVRIGDYVSCCSKRIYNKEHALDIIKGINKAIELGWFK